MPRILRPAIFSLFVLIGLELIGQSASSQIEFRADNDFWLSTDRYYTTGSFITYRRLLNRDTTLEKTITVSTGIRQQLYTPSDIRSDIVRQYDRPYAGFLGLSGTYTLIQAQEFLIAEGVIGVAGPASGAEEFQNLFHENGGIDTPPWTAQIENSFHANLYAQFGREWNLSKNKLNWIIAAQPGLAIGTRDIYFNPEVALYFGKRNKANESVAYHQLGPLQDELFIRLITAYRFVYYDAMLEGNFLGDDSPFLVEANQHLFKFALEACWRWGKNDFRAGYHYTTSETPLAENHAFGLLSYARSFN
ncbi:lipid A-modifier LpxR family protein [Aureitalea marina]|uniref:Lipid A deacylase LpxR family protein n=1 Tax=Aureitalea marina TaxID=930804 RepID=A0A2S7KLK0_9FLAO|nr:lipid A-modifier LpxR family protein [Aureitalea marina]PQB03509.1 hypothetical protein BST85_00310 [Aureitalea marina]